MKSYSSVQKNFGDVLNEFWHVYRYKTANIAESVAVVVDTAREMEVIVQKKLGIRLEGRDLLEIGAGQQLLRLKYFGAKNRVQAIDYDRIPQGFDPGAYWHTLRRNGARRTVKTFFRKLSGIDRRYWRELEKFAGKKVHDRMPVVQGDAHHLPWPDASFDFVYSFSVFEHLTDPDKALGEVMRVLRPGGGFCISTHSYTSENGAHDPRIFSGQREDIPLWAHLRPAHKMLVKPNAYCNEWRLSQWEEVFREKCRTVVFEYKEAGVTDALRDDLKRLRGESELAGYSDRELLTVDLWALGRK